MAAWLAWRAAWAVTRPRWLPDGEFCEDFDAADFFGEEEDDLAAEFFAAGADLVLLAERSLARVFAALLRCAALELSLARVLAACFFAEALAPLLELLPAALRLPLARVFAALLRWAALVPSLARVLAACFLVDASPLLLAPLLELLPAALRLPAARVFAAWLRWLALALLLAKVLAACFFAGAFEALVLDFFAVLGISNSLL